MIGISSDVPSYIISRDPVTNQPNGGYLYYLHNEMAGRGGYTIQYQTVADISLYRTTGTTTTPMKSNIPSSTPYKHLDHDSPPLYIHVAHPLTHLPTLTVKMNG